MGRDGEHFALDSLENAEAATSLCKVLHTSSHRVCVLLWTVADDRKQSLSQELPLRIPSAGSLLATPSPLQPYLPPAWRTRLLVLPFQLNLKRAKSLTCFVVHLAIAGCCLHWCSQMTFRVFFQLSLSTRKDFGN